MSDSTSDLPTEAPRLKGRGAPSKRRPALITQSEVARIIRAAKQTGAASVEVRIGDQTSVVIRLDQSTSAAQPAEPIVL